MSEEIHALKPTPTTWQALIVRDLEGYKRKTGCHRRPRRDPGDPAGGSIAVDRARGLEFLRDDLDPPSGRTVRRVTVDGPVGIGRPIRNYGDRPSDGNSSRFTGGVPCGDVHSPVRGLAAGYHNRPKLTG